MIPGRALHRVALCICSAKTVERVVEPAIADLQTEYAGAGGDRAFRRVWVLLTGYASILKVMTICALSVSITTDDERRTLRRTLAWSVVLVVAVSVVLMLPPLYGFDQTVLGWYAATTLVPQALALAIPIGVAFGIAFGLRARPTLSIAKMMLLGAVAASALSFSVLAWAVPVGNQAFREITFRELRTRGYQGPIAGLQKGYSEMTFSELRRESARFMSDGEPRRARQLAFSFHLRFALAAATLALATLLLAAPVNHRGFRGLLTLAACFVYWVLMFVGQMGSRRGYLPQPIGAWLPNLVLIAGAMVIALRASPTVRLKPDTTY